MNKRYEMITKFTNGVKDLFKEKVITNYSNSLDDFKQDILSANSNDELLQVISNHLNQFKQIELINLGIHQYNKPIDYNHNSLIYWSNHNYLNNIDFDWKDFHSDETTISYNDFIAEIVNFYLRFIMQPENIKSDTYEVFKKRIMNTSTFFVVEENGKYQLHNILNTTNILLGGSFEHNANLQFATIAYKKIDKSCFNELKTMFFNYKQWKISTSKQNQKIGLLFWEQIKRCFKNKKVLKLLEDLYIKWNVVLEVETINIDKTINVLDHLINLLVVWNVKQVIKPVSVFKEIDIG